MGGGGRACTTLIGAGRCAAAVFLAGAGASSAAAGAWRCATFVFFAFGGAASSAAAGVGGGVTGAASAAGFGLGSQVPSTREKPSAQRCSSASRRSVILVVVLLAVSCAFDWESELRAWEASEAPEKPAGSLREGVLVQAPFCSTKPVASLVVVDAEVAGVPAVGGIAGIYPTQTSLTAGVPGEGMHVESDGAQVTGGVPGVEPVH